MARLTIPKRYYGGLATLRRLGEEAFEQLLGALGKAAPTADARRLREEVVPQIQAISPQEAEELLDTVWGLYWVRTVMDFPVDGFASELVVAMRETRNDDLVLPEDEVPRFVERVVRLLAFESLNSATKAAELASDYPQLFCSAEVVTDLRPVFGADSSQRPVGAVVTHTLRLQYHKGNDREVLHIALDSGAIGKLKEVLEKAQAESRTLKSFLAETGLSELGGA